MGKSDLPGVRLDSGIQNGDEVTVNYDPMIAKLIVHAENREMAISKMQKALNDFPFLGLKIIGFILKRFLAQKLLKKGKPGRISLMSTQSYLSNVKKETSPLRILCMECFVVVFLKRPISLGPILAQRNLLKTNFKNLGIKLWQKN